MKVAFFNLEGWEPEVYGQTFKGHNVEVLQHPFQQEGITVDKTAAVAEAEILSIDAMSPVNQAVMEALPKLQLIATRCVGTDHIDVAFAKEKGIAVSNVPVYGENTVAEFTFALILALARRLSNMFDRSKHGRLDRKDLRGIDLAGSTLGVIGTGRIGSQVVKIASAFGMRILCYSIHAKPELMERYGARYIPLEELLQSSDVITIHVALTPETYHLINRDNIALLKKGALLVNAARGPLPRSRLSSGPWKTTSWEAWRWIPLKGSFYGSRRPNWCTTGPSSRLRIISRLSKVFIYNGTLMSSLLPITPLIPPRRCIGDLTPIWMLSWRLAKKGRYVIRSSDPAMAVRRNRRPSLHFRWIRRTTAHRRPEIHWRSAKIFVPR